MSGDRIFHGLCITCRNASHCAFPRNPAMPVWQCEEFMGDGRSAERVSFEGSRPFRTGLISQEMDLGPGIGLCKNCENRETCNFPKPEGGVWRCEEYL